MEGREATHVVLGRTAPLLHVHDFHVQHSTKLHFDPAKVMHRSVRRAAAAAPGREEISYQARRITTFIAVSVIQQFSGPSTDRLTRGRFGAD